MWNGSRLQLEQAWLAESGRIEREAEAELGMLRPGAGRHSDLEQP